MITRLYPLNSVENSLNGIVSTPLLELDQAVSIQSLVELTRNSLLRLNQHHSLDELHFLLAMTGLNLVVAEVDAINLTDQIWADLSCHTSPFTFLSNQQNYGEWLQGTVLVALSSMALLTQQNLLQSAEAAIIRCGLLLVSTEIEKLVALNDN